MKIELLEPQGGPIRLEDWFWSGDAPDRGLWEVPGSERRLSQSHIQPGSPRVRRLAHWTIPGLRALDRIEFVLGDDEFAEVGRYLRKDGPNQHLRRIQLPARLPLHQWFNPIEGHASRVRLGWVGKVRVQLGEEAPVELEAIRLDASEGGREVLTWLARGVGEFAWGRPEQLDRWLIAWNGGDSSLFGGLPEKLLTLELPELPEGPTPETPKASVL